MRGLHQEMSFESKDWTGDSSRPAGGPIDPLRYNRAYPIGLNRSPFSDKLNFPFSQTMLITFVHPVSSEKESNQHESSQTADRKKNNTSRKQSRACLSRADLLLQTKAQARTTAAAQFSNHAGRI